MATAKPPHMNGSARTNGSALYPSPSTTNTTATSPHLQIDHRTTRSLQTALLQTSLRPFKKHLFPTQTQPAGSPTLTSPPFVHKKCNVHERIVEGIKVYDINVRSESTDRYVAYTGSVVNTSHEDLKGRVQPAQQQNGAAKMPKGGRGNIATEVASALPIPSNRLPQAQAQAQAQVAVPHHPRPSTPPLPTTNTNGTAQAPAPPIPDTSEPLTLTRTKTRDFAHRPTTTHPRPRPRQIIYFAGGGWSQPASKQHWQFLTHLCVTLNSKGSPGGAVPTTISLVSYPLAPHCPASVTLPQLERCYYALFAQALQGGQSIPDALNAAQYTSTPLSALEAKEGPEIIIAGDSSGGNIALALVLSILKKDENAPAPDSLFLMSPSVKMAVDNPKIRELEKKDPVLSLEAITRTHSAWLGGVPVNGHETSTHQAELADSRVSPLYGDLSVLRRRGVSVNGMNAGYDVLGPDCDAFIERLKEEGVRGRWLCWERMMHCFPLTFAYGIKEGREGVAWVVDTIQRERGLVGATGR